MFRVPRANISNISYSFVIYSSPHKRAGQRQAAGDEIRAIAVLRLAIVWGKLDLWNTRGGRQAFDAGVEREFDAAGLRLSESEYSLKATVGNGTLHAQRIHPDAFAECECRIDVLDVGRSDLQNAGRN